MQVKIDHPDYGNIVVDSDDVPVMIKMSDEEKQLIHDMTPDNNCFCAYPENANEYWIAKWMKE